MQPRTRKPIIRRLLSNFMMGVTAAASAVVYLHRGQIDPGIAMPVCIGVLTGATVGSKVLVKAKTDKLKIVFAIVVAFLALQMIYKGLTSGA